MSAYSTDIYMRYIDNFFFFQAEDGIRDVAVTGVQTCALPIFTSAGATLTVNAASSPLQITITQLPGGSMASSYNAALSASGGSAPYTWSLLSGDRKSVV